MKRNLLLIVFVLVLISGSMAQSPQAINFQAVARNNAGSVLINQQVSIRLSILKGSLTGTLVYVEKHTKTTDSYGLFTLQIGRGTVQSGIFDNINWGEGSYFLKVEVDPEGGTQYQAAGSSQFASVPYSFHSKTAENGLPTGQYPGDILYWDGVQWVHIPIGTTGQTLNICGGLPVWGTCQDLPAVITTAPTAIAYTRASTGGNVTNSGASPVTIRGVCYSTVRNPTVQDDTIRAGSGTGSFTADITNLSYNTTYHIRAFATNSSGTVYGKDYIFTSAPWICGSSIVPVDHTVAGGVAPVDMTVFYGTVTNIPGETSKCWITRNLGASQQATSKSDNSEAAAGWYWQFNRKQGYMADGNVRTPNTAWITIVSENTDWQQQYDPCSIEMGNGWRIPTYSEWNNVDITGNWSNWDGPWNSGLKLHVAGFLYYGTGILTERGIYGSLWSSTQLSVAAAWNLDFSTSKSAISNDPKTYGTPLRCIKD